MKIQNLYEISQILSKSGRKEIQILFGKNKKLGISAEKALFELLSGSMPVNDEEAILHLYGEKNDSTRHRYHMTKDRSKWKFLAGLLMLDSSKFTSSPVYVRRYEWIVLCAVIDVLMQEGGRQPAVELARNIVKEAEHFEEAKTVYKCYKTLYDEAMFAGKIKAASRFAERLEFWIHAQHAEDIADLMLQRSLSEYVANWSLQQNNLPKIRAYIADINGKRKEYNTHKLHILYYSLSITYHEIGQNYEDIIDIGQEMFAYLQTKPHLATRNLQARCHLAMFGSYIWLHDYDMALNIARDAEALLRRGTVVWFSFKQLQCILHLRMGTYSIAAEVFNGVAEQLMHSNADEILREQWRLFEFYVRFAAGSEHVETSLLLSPEEKKVDDSRLFYRRFASNLQMLRRDADGYGIVAIFAYVLHLLSEGEYDELIQWNDTLSVLRRARLTRLNYRLAMTARLIDVMVECGFNHAKSEKKGKRFHLLLLNTPKKYRHGTVETLEIIPFEELWAMMLNLLRR